MHSWRLIPRTASLCLPVAMVASGFALSSAHDGRAELGAASTSSRAVVAPKFASGLDKVEKPKATPTAPTVKSQQTAVPTVDRTKLVDKNLVAELPATTTKNFGMVGVTWAAGAKGTNFAVTVRTRLEGKWSAWTDMALDDTSDEGRPGTEPLWVGKADGVSVKVLSPDGQKPDDIKVMTIDPGTTPNDGNLPTVTSAGYTTNAPIDGVVHATQTADGAPTYTGQPAIISRAAWGARANTTCDTPRYGNSTHGVVVHHTAGSNSYTQAQSAAIVRGDQAYHMDGHGWCDIGYNFLVDKYGQIFEGRNGGIDRPVRAAHSGNGEVNLYDMGIAMAGTFETSSPSTALKDSMVRLIGWRLGTNYLKAKGTYYVGETITANDRYGSHTLNMISGHRNVVSTDCPGKLGQAWIVGTSGLRDRVEAYMANYKSAIKTKAAALGSTLTGRVYIGEAPVSNGGRHTVFNKRDIWWSQATGAHSTLAPMIAAYKALGNEKSQLGFPSGEYGRVSTSNVGIQRFAGGSMYLVRTSTSLRNYSLWGDIAKMYVSLKEANGILGAPKSNVVNYTTGKTRATFTNGYITFTAATKQTVATKTDGSVIQGATTTTLKVPAVTAGLKAAPTTTSAALSWSAASGAAYYGVCLKTESTNTACAKWFGNIKTTSVNATGLVPTAGTDYSFTVLAYNSAGYSRSAESPFNLKTLVPAVTTGLKAAPTTTGATLSWSPASGANYYGVCLMQEVTDAACWKWFGNITKTSLSVTGLKPTAGTDYVFTVLAYNSAGFSRSAKASFNLSTSTTTPESTKTDTLTVPASRTFTLTGHGFGHGIGMSQYGAQGAAIKGVTYGKILGYYYPGTTLATKTGNIRVLITKDTDPSVVVKARTGLVFRIVKSNKTITLPSTIGGAKVTYWQIVPRSGAATSSLLQYKTSAWHTYNTPAWTGDAQFEAGANAVALVLPSHTEVPYRGTLRSAVPKSGSTDRNTVNVASVDNYVRGVVAAEMPASWKSEALKAQSVAARTYGVRSLAPSNYYDICDTTSCQVYGGAGRETSTTDAAVAATKGRILTYGGTPAFTQFSSSSGGWSAAGSFAYLKAKVDAYDDFSGNGVHDWTFSAKASTLENKYPTIGTLKILKVTKRTGGGDWGGRVSGITLTGSKSSKTLTGNDMRFVLGLRSNWFRFN